MLGKIKWYNRERGIGFIETETEDDVFLHRSYIIESERNKLEQGEEVEFDIDDGQRGRRAVNVKRRLPLSFK